jgi:hypothetical protein
LCMLQVLASIVFLGFESLGTRDHILLTRKVTVEVFDPASTRMYSEAAAEPRYITSAPTAQKTSHVVPIVACRLTAAEMCLLLRCVATAAAWTTYKTVSLLRFVYRAVA